MNITTNYPNVSLVTTNPATDRVVQDNAVRPIIPPTVAVEPTLKEQATASQHDASRQQPASVTNPTYDLPTVMTPEEIEREKEQQGNQQESQQDPENKEQAEDNQPTPDEATEPNGRYSESEQHKITELAQRDAVVVAHEMAHSTTGGQYAGAPNYSYETGPDGGKYAVSGEVSIDTSVVANDPQATLRKARQIKAAALAPAEPSSQDRRVAMKADQMAQQARQEILAAGRDDAENGYRPLHQIESDSFNRRINMSQDQEFQATLKRRSSHIDAFYNQAAQPLNASALSRQI